VQINAGGPVQCDIIVKLSKYVPVRNQVLTVAILRLLHNLSFDSSLRADMVAAGMVPKLVDLMREARCVSKVAS
jgi:hypothetical protein